MKTQDILIAHPQTNEQILTLKAFMEALKIKFEVATKTYNPDFVEKIMESREQVRNGEITMVDNEHLQEFLGI